MEPLLVVNPATGHRRETRSLDAVLAAAERALGGVEVAYTGRPGHAIEIARAAALAGRDPIVAVGGDGTLNEVVNGVMQAREAAPGSPPARVGLIGRGTGGDFGRSLDIDHRLDSYLSALASGRERAVDLLRATFTGNDGRPARRYVVNVLSAGAGGLVDRYVAGLPRALGGRAAYLLASLRALAVCPRARLLMRTTDAAGAVAERELAAYLVCVCNGRVFGGGMRVAPMADPGDGLLEVVVAATDTKWGLVRALPKVYAGTHLGVPGVEHLSATRVELELLDGEAAGRFLLDVDGDPLGRLPVALEVVPGALTMLA